MVENIIELLERHQISYIILEPLTGLPFDICAILAQAELRHHSWS